MISGSIGYDDWEWGVDLFAQDPLVFKKLIYEMRFDEASAKFAEFGPFYTGLQFDIGAAGRVFWRRCSHSRLGTLPAVRHRHVGVRSTRAPARFLHPEFVIQQGEFGQFASVTVSSGPDQVSLAEGESAAPAKRA